MSELSEAFSAHLKMGTTTLARCWQVDRKDGQVLGFTDHDRDLDFLDTTFKADTGLSARLLEQSTGLAIDNTEAIGALNDSSITETDIRAGRFDGARVTCWLVNWSDVTQRLVMFRGRIGEIAHEGGAFRAELLGLTEALNRPVGRVFQKPCSAVLGDAACGVDISSPQFSIDASVVSQEDGRKFQFADLTAFETGWFTKGVVTALTGEAAGLSGVIKRDDGQEDARRIELWAPIPVPIEAGDRLRLVAGCDKRFATCQSKFANTLNFRGFPDLPGDDWVLVGPKDTGGNTGGSLRT